MTLWLAKEWLEHFLCRHGIRLMSITGKKFSNDSTCIKAVKLRFLQKVKDLDLNQAQVYNAVKSGLFWHVLPNKKFVKKNLYLAVSYISKERITMCERCRYTHSKDGGRWKSAKTARIQKH